MNNGRSGRRRRTKAKKRRASRRTSEPRPKIESSIQPTQDGDDAERVLKRFWYDKQSLVPAGFVVWVCGCLVGILPAIAARYVTCPQQAVGWRRTVLAVFVGIPVGLGLTTLLLIALSLSMPALHTRRSSTTIRRLSEWGALGAVYGTLPAAVSTVFVMARKPGSSCDVDLFQTLGNGAVWGTLAAFSLGLPTMLRSLLADYAETKRKGTRFWIQNALMDVPVIGGIYTVILVINLNQGTGWPS